ncbi:protein of unknown function DUF6 transmembrane [Denitrovibrio acetiphilus DSM 12809]|uniref:EamA domain-containing protein n=1 Tax=Denitrovibrio acetiphilus (strain DSM 12809 / NBRC 114555 / N2460) TaxID=522772 RepID=D4H5D6_DENA2|nr:DMT family transporter [Denitrovibrio acetiphilus]ADD67556.1 protein of unknown function DUF6 transmembrane [Denitrovibrio acetiphilus DSM 12809]
MSDIERKMLFAHLNMFLWALIVGLSFPAVGILTEGLPPMFLTSIRFIVAIFALVPFLFNKKGVIPDLKGFLLYALMALCLAGFFCGMFWSAHKASSIAMSTLYLSVPLIAYIFGRFVMVEKRNLSLLLMLMAGAGGAFWLALADAGGGSDGFHFGIGEFIFFLGCIASALYPVLSKLGINRGWLSGVALVRTFWSLFLGSIIMALAGFIFESPADLLNMNIIDLVLVVYLGIFSSGLTFWLQQSATGVLTPATVTAYSYMIPFVSMFIVFRENPSVIGWEWLPGSVIVLGAVAALLKQDVGTLFRKRM